MKRLEQINKNTREIYNKCMLEHFDESGFDYSDRWRIDWLLGMFDGGRLLDVGCGVSPLALLATKKQNSEVWAIDFADEFIKKMDETYNEIDYVVGDMNDLPFLDNYFDYVVLGEVLEHAESPQRLAKEAKRVAKKNGIIAISVPDSETKETHKYPQHIWSINEKDIRRLFNVIKVEIIGNTLLCYAKS